MKKKSLILPYTGTLLLFLIITYYGKTGSFGEEFGFMILNYIILMPIVSLISGLILCLFHGKASCYYPVFIFICYLFFPWMVFHTLEIQLAFYSVIPSVVGILLGFFIRWIKNKRKNSH